MAASAAAVLTSAFSGADSVVSISGAEAHEHDSSCVEAEGLLHPPEPAPADNSPPIQAHCTGELANAMVR
jgi:hypothetical protein